MMAHKDIALYPIEDHGLLLDQRNGALNLTNPVATQIWQQITSGSSSQDIIDELHTLYDVPVDILQRDLTAILQQWTQLGFITDGDIQEDREIDPQLQYSRLADTVCRDNSTDISYQLAELKVTIHYPDSSCISYINTMLSHYITALPHTQADVSFEILQHDDVYLIRKNGDFVYGDIHIEHIKWVIYDELIQLLYSDSDWMVSIHAGTMSIDGKTILMPAVSGSGKSTLCATLMNNGYHYYGDDVAVIRQRDRQLMPLPTTLSIKTGSWDLLSQWHPELTQQDASTGTRNRVVKYLNAAQPEIGDAYCTAVNFLVFPRYAADEEAACIQLTDTEKFQKLIESGLWFDQPVDQHKFESFLDWVQAMPAYSMVYSSTEQALDWFTELL